jgi:hypothetical protein
VLSTCTVLTDMLLQSTTASQTNGPSPLQKPTIPSHHQLMHVYCTWSRPAAPACTHLLERTQLKRTTSFSLP